MLMWAWMLGLSLILIQSIFEPFHPIPLSGEEWVQHAEELSLERIEDQSFQKEVDHWTTKKFGFRNLAVRLYNQLLYSVFNETTHFIELGDAGFLFEKVYRATVCGENLLDRAEVDKKLDSLDLFGALLSKRGQKLVFVITPNKYRFFSDKVESRCESNKTNYAYFKAGFDRADYTVFDFNELFPKMESSFPLMPKSGTHWSLYGAFRAAQLIQDSLVKWGYAGAPLEISAIETDIHPRETDKDLHDLLNVITYAPTEELAYPFTDYYHEKKPRMLVVGDSFYETFYRIGVHSQVYHDDSKLLYYNKKLFAKDINNGESFDSQDLDIALNKTDVVMIVSNEDALKTLGWGFLSDAIELLNE